MISIREESCRVVYEGAEPRFIIKSNGQVEWLKLVKATAQDMEDIINQRAV